MITQVKMTPWAPNIAYPREASQSGGRRRERTFGMVQLLDADKGKLGPYTCCSSSTWESHSMPVLLRRPWTSLSRRRSQRCLPTVLTKIPTWLLEYWTHGISLSFSAARLWHPNVTAIFSSLKWVCQSHPRHLHLILVSCWGTLGRWGGLFLILTQVFQENPTPNLL